MRGFVSFGPSARPTPAGASPTHTATITVSLRIPISLWLSPEVDTATGYPVPAAERNGRPSYNGAVGIPTEAAETIMWWKTVLIVLILIPWAEWSRWRC